MNLSGPQQHTLYLALQRAFPTRPDLTKMVRFHLDENLDVISSSPGSDCWFDLIQWAIKRGKLAHLVHSSLRENSGNPELLSVAHQLLSAATPTTASPPPPTSPAPQLHSASPPPRPAPNNPAPAPDTYPLHSARGHEHVRPRTSTTPWAPIPKNPSLREPSCVSETAAKPAIGSNDVLRIEAELDAFSDTNFYTNFLGDIRDHGGIFVAAENSWGEIRLLTPCAVRMSFPGALTAEVRGIVRWKRDRWGNECAGIGVEITHASPDAWQLVDRYMKRREPIICEP